MLNFKDTVEILKGFEVNCKSISIDLRYITYFADDDGCMLVDSKTKKEYLFPKREVKTDFLDPSWPLKQLCKMIKIPYSFLIENRPKDQMDMFNKWLKVFAPEEREEALVLLKIREEGTITIIRSILSYTLKTIPYSNFIESFRGKDEKFPEIIYENGVQKDSMLIKLRFFYPFYEKCFNDFYPAVSLYLSDVDLCKPVIDIGLYNQESNVFLWASYAKKPFSTISYERIQPEELSTFLKTLPERIKKESLRYSTTLMDFHFTNVNNMYEIISNNKNFSTSFKKKLLLEVLTSRSDMETTTDFIVHAGNVAKSLKSYKDRLKAERSIGLFFGLNFEKIEEKLK